MNIIMLSGSRNPEGQTARAMQALAQGARAAGALVHEVYLPQQKIERCRQCDATGWGRCRTDGRCIIEDDFQVLIEDVRAANLVVFATPVYFSDLSESLRAFLDRLRRVAMHPTGKSGIEGKRALGICVAGGGGGGSYLCVASLDKILQNCGFDILDIIPVRRQNLAFKCEVLRLTGKWLAEESAT